MNGLNAHVSRHLYVPLKKYARTPVLPLLRSHTHAIKQSASDQSQCSLPSPPPFSLSAVCSMSCKHYPSNGSLEDTKTSSCLTPDTDLRALTVAYLGIKHRRTNIQGHPSSFQQEESIQREDKQSRQAVNPANALPPHG